MKRRQLDWWEDLSLALGIWLAVFGALVQPEPWRRERASHPT
ncbi:MAG TPA: hypothetical protein VEM13_04615 [Gemmatimonadales bacterium]|nr:hypothetical protein [Gemmatimonadales bacterium]